MLFITSAHVTIMFIHGNRKIWRCHFSVVSSCTGTQRNETLTNWITTPCMDMKTIGNPPCTGKPGQPPFFPDNRKSHMKHHHLHLAVCGHGRYTGVPHTYLFLVEKWGSSGEEGTLPEYKWRRIFFLSNPGLRISRWIFGRNRRETKELSNWCYLLRGMTVRQT